MVDILDSVTLQKLQSLEFPGEKKYYWNLVFSPDSRGLTACGYDGGYMFVVIWDLQTGGTTGVTRWDKPKRNYMAYPHLAYSTNGKMVAVLHRDRDQPIFISVCDIVSKLTHNIDTAINAIPCGLWTHGEFLWFATIDQIPVEATGPKSITVRKVGLTPTAVIIAVETFPVPEGVTLSKFTRVDFPQFSACSQPLLTPSLPVVFCDRCDILVLDARNSKILLHLQDFDEFLGATCSSGGGFFACSIPGSGIYLWKDSPTGYVLRGKLPLPARFCTPLLSPNGESIIIISDFAIKLWRMKTLPITPSDTFVEAPRQTGNFILQFLPHRSLAVVSRNGGSTVTLLDLGSGNPQLTINTGIKVLGLGATEDAVVVISDGGATTWKLPGGSFLPGAAVNVADSAQTVHFDTRSRNTLDTGSISPDSRYILIQDSTGRYMLYSATTGKLFYQLKVGGDGHWFTPDGRNVGAISANKGCLLEITTQSHLRSVEMINIEQGRYGCPHTSPNYQVTDGGWILGPSKERLLILPPLWRSYTLRRRWNGQFLALLDGLLPEPVILELPNALSLEID